MLIGKRLALALFISGLLLILFTTLQPFTFSFAGRTWRDLFAGYVLLSSSYRDFLRNIFLFVPFGMGLAALLQQRGWATKRIGLSVAAAGFTLTLFVETAQNFLPLRQPSVADLATNTAGALLGMGCLLLLQDHARATVWLRKTLAKPGVVLAAVAIYTGLLLVFAYALASGVRLSGWNTSYALLLGNEVGAERPWLGTMKDLLIFDRALSADEARRLLHETGAFASDDTLLAHYPLANGSLQEAGGRQPDLGWYAGDTGPTQNGSWPLDGSTWLVSESAVGDLSRSLVDTSQFTIRLSAEPDLPAQWGPARLVTISGSVLDRNLTIGQEDADLVLRLRSRLAGDNGAAPQNIFADLFSPAAPVEFVLTFDGLSLTLLDSTTNGSRRIEMVPGVAFVDAVLPFLGDYWQASDAPAYQWAARLFFYLAVLLLPGLLVTRPQIARWPPAPRLLLLLLVLIGIPLLLELAQVSPSGRPPRPLNIFSAVMVLLLVGWIIAPAMSWLRRAVASPKPSP